MARWRQSYVKAKLEMIAANDFTPQMQLSHALKDARLALDAAEDYAVADPATIADCWDEAADEGMPIVTASVCMPGWRTADKRVLSAKCRGRREGVCDTAARS